MEAALGFAEMGSLLLEDTEGNPGISTSILELAASRIVGSKLEFLITWCLVFATAAITQIKTFCTILTPLQGESLAVSI